MKRRGGTAGRATKKPVVVLAGEDGNDRKSLRILIEAACPDMRGRIVEIYDDVRLRAAKSGELAKRVKVLAGKARARAAREGADLACVFIHEDLDEPDGDVYLEARQRVQTALDQAFPSAHYVLSVAEMEAWMLLFPDAISAVVASWNVPARYRGKDTGRFGDPKQIMKRDVSAGKRVYRESDAAAIFERVVSLGCLDKPSGSNRSWKRFRTDTVLCSSDHLTT